MRTIKIILFTLICTCSFNTIVADSPRKVYSLDKGWRFHLGDIEFPVVKGHRDSYHNAKAGRANGAASAVYDDTKWRLLDLPHDWAVEGGFNPDANLSQGYRDRGYGWYRRQFWIDEQDKGKHIELQFDGISTHATIWVNGTVLHRNWCGYTSMYIDITPYVTYGSNINTIAVRVDANTQEGWWYEGAGIYRHTWLVMRSPVHIITDGLLANPIKKNNSEWLIPAEISLYNSGAENAEAIVEISVTDNDGKMLATAKQQVDVVALRENITKINVSISDPNLWSPCSPTLYTVTAKIIQDGILSDEASLKTGFRTVKFDKDTGFWLNGENIKLKGVCNHQDHAGVGVAVPDALWEYRLGLLKEMGVNAYRCAHNPVAKEFMDACDSLGIMVMDENRLFNTSPEYVRQLEWLVKRDRSRPSVIMWSVFNEEPMQGTENGYEMVRRMVDVVKRLDSTRPVTAAMNGGLFTEKNVSQAVDVVGFNYQINSYDNFRKSNPDMCITSAEDGSAFSVRGEYVTDRNKNLIDSYDIEHAAWGSSHRTTWQAIDERPWIAGGFYWTGFDYRGEPTPYSWPSVSSFFGIMDLCGFPKSSYYIHKAHWRKDIPALKLIPHWNWPADSVGKPIQVMALSNVDSIVIKLNGKLISGQKADKYQMNTWSVPYVPGKLEAVGYDINRKVIARDVVETTGEPVTIKMTPHRNTLKNDGADAIPITVEVLDKKGRHVPTANIPLEYEISGSGKIIGLGNGNPNSHEPEKGNKRSLFNGLSQIIIQSEAQGKSSITLTAKSEKMKPVSITIPLLNVDQIPSIEAKNPNIRLTDWIHSPFLNEKPDPNQIIADNDMNTWTQAVGNTTLKSTGGKYVLFRILFSASQNSDQERSRIMFKNIEGKAEIWLNGELFVRKNDKQKGNVEFDCPKNMKSFDLRVLLENDSGSETGFGEVLVSGMIIN